MIFIEQKRDKLRLSEHPATHTSPFKLKCNIDTLAFKINAKSQQNQKADHCGALNQVYHLSF
jgi:hypothetical protein